MKKILLTSLLALGTYASAQCVPITAFPKNYDFEDATVPALPTCWTVASSGTGNDWNIWSADGNYGTTVGDKLLNNSLPVSAIGSAWAFTDGFTMTGGQPYSVGYTSWATNSTNNRIISIGFGTTASDAGMTIFGTDASVNATHETSAFVFTPPTTGTYYIGVKVHNTAANSEATSVLIDHVLVKMENTLAVSDAKSKSKISVYPNPVNDILRLSDVKNIKSVSVGDMSGRQIKTFAPDKEINLSDLKTGNYIISLTMNDGSIQTFNTIKK